MDTEDLPANNAPLTINEQVMLSQLIIPITFLSTFMKCYQNTDVP